MDNSNMPPPSQPSAPSTQPPVPPPLRPPPPPLPPRPVRKRNGWRIAALVLAVLLAFSLFSHLGSLASWLFKSAGPMSHAAGPKLEEITVQSNDSANKIAIIPIEGVILSEGFDRSGYNLVRYIEDQLKMAERDDKVKAVILKVNSPGGEVLASDDINHAIAEFQKKSRKPVLASMGSLAASGGYYVSVPCRWIVANELTITGSIGVIMHSWNYRGLMNKVGLRPQVFKSGRFKDMLSPERDLDKLSPQERTDLEEEERMIQSLIDQTFARFKKVVEEGRRNANKLNKDDKDSPGQTLTSKWAEYADGRVLSGKEAHELGFVDELGNWETAVKRTRELAHIADADLVQYQQIFDITSLFRLFGKSEAPSIKVDWGMELPKLQPGQLYFLSPTYLR